MRKKKLGEILRERGLISADDLSRALEEQQRKVILLGEVLLERNLVSRADLVASLEEVTNVPFIDCRSAAVDPKALKLVPYYVAVRHGVLPIAFDGNRIIVVMAEPQNLQAIDELRFRTGKVVSPRLGFRKEIVATLDEHYRSPSRAPTSQVVEEGGTLDHVDIGDVEFVSGSTRQSSRDALLEIQAELRSKPTPAVRFVSAAIAVAVEKDASDIHIEPQGKSMVVRMRVDGILRELARVPAELQTAVISRLKVLADMDIAERRKPQDGRIVVRIGKKDIDLRISTLPTHQGEKTVIRLLDPSAPRLQFRDLGMSAGLCETINRLLDRPQGMLLVTGPTGSGKTTTLYAALNQLRSPSVNIVTVEDPVEYLLEGITQVQVHTKAGLTFAQCLRSILRQDPNIIMVGEIRDGDTAEIAMKASQTGHLVLTTIHTNDSVAAIARLSDLKIAPSLIASSVTAIMSQRLVRKLCACRQQVAATPEYLAHLVAAGLEDSEKTMCVPGQCPDCDQSGYRGRISVSEILVLDEEMRAMIRADARPDQIRVMARGKGMRTMQEDALDRVRAGLTSLDEILRVITFEEFSGARCSKCARELAEMFLFCPYCGTKRCSSVVSDSQRVRAGLGDIPS